MSANYRYSPQREAILDLLQADRNHLTADEVHRKVRREFPSLSLGTVYRNLRILQEMGKVDELVYDGGSSHYEARREPHYHVVCRQCRRIEDVHAPLEESPADSMRFPSGWSVDAHRLEFTGLCSGCRAAG